MSFPFRPLPAIVQASRRPRVALYSHDTMGIGHMRRNLLIAQTLSTSPINATVLLVAGAREASAFQLPAGVDCITVPSLYKDTDGRYQSRSLDVNLHELTTLRSQTIVAAIRAFNPDVFIVDKEPRGALGELDATLAMLRRRGNTKCVLGLRDVLDQPVTVQKEWRQTRNEVAVDRYFDAVWVYGDPRVYDLINECFLNCPLKSKVSYTGYLDPRHRLQIPESTNRTSEKMDDPFCLCMVGGGQDGASLAQAFAASELPAGHRGVIITGPCMPSDLRAKLKQQCTNDSRWQIHDFHPEPCRLLANAERVIAMGGYNTVSEILAFEKPALVVPRIQPRQEQLIRAERLCQMGLLDLLRPENSAPQPISEWMHSERPLSTGARQSIDFEGLNRVQSLFTALNPANSRMSRSDVTGGQHVGI